MENNLADNLKQLIGIYGLSRAISIIDTMIKEDDIETVDELNDIIIDELHSFVEYTLTKGD